MVCRFPRCERPVAGRPFCRRHTTDLMAAAAFARHALMTTVAGARQRPAATTRRWMP